METLEQKVVRLTSELEDLSAQVPRNETQINLTTMSLDEAKAELAQEQAAMVRIQDATEQAAYFLDTLEVEGLTMRQLCSGESEYQLLRIAMQSQFMKMAEDNSDQIRLLETQHAENLKAAAAQVIDLQSKLEAQTDFEQTITELRGQLSQAVIERDDFEGKLVNAGKEIDRLNGHIDDLRKEIAVGARNAFKVIDSEEQSKQLKALADQIKANRVYVYDVVPDNVINPKNFTAKRVDNGDSVTYNWTQANNFIEVKDAAEVERFRQQFADKEANANIPLGNETTADVDQEETFPSIPQATLPTVPTPVVGGTPEDAGQSQTVEERLNALEKRVVELEKVCNVNEEAA